MRALIAAGWLSFVGGVAVALLAPSAGAVYVALGFAVAGAVVLSRDRRAP